MAIYTSNTNRVTGLSSGLDIDNMVDQLMQAESTKYNNLEKQQTWITWQQEAYREIIQALQDFESKWFTSSNTSNNIGYSAFWNQYESSITDINGNSVSGITVKSATATENYVIEVQQVATAESITGSEIKNRVTTTATIDEIKSAIDEAGTISFNIDLDGKTQTITINASDIGDADSIPSVLETAIQNAFNNDKIKVDKNNDGTISFTTSSTSILKFLEGTGLTEGVSTTQQGVLAQDKYEFTIAIDGEEYTVTADFTSCETAEEKINVIKDALKEATNSSDDVVDISNKVSLSFSIDESDESNLIIKNTSSNAVYEISSNGNYTTLQNSSNLDKLGLTSGTISVSTKSKLTDVLGDDFTSLFEESGDDAIELNFGGTNFTIGRDDTVQELINKIKASGAGVELSFNQVTGRFKLTATNTGADNGINIDDKKTLEFLDFLGIDIENKESTQGYISAQDAIITIDGIDVERSSNDIEMNGLSISITSAAVGKGEITVSTQSDTDVIFNKLKDFVEDYNNLVEKLQNAVTEVRARDSEYGYYEPLSTAEREAMTDEEIEKWEAQAKTGLLYNDSTISSMLSKLRNLAYTSIDVGGVTISLYEIGISHTSDYNSQKLEIDEDKLKKAIQERGDEIAAMFTQSKTGIADQIKTIVNDAIGTNGTLREKAGIANTASVNNNELSKQLKEIAERLSAEKTRLKKKETYYYNMFAAMEAAMTTANTQLSVITSLLGYSY